MSKGKDFTVHPYDTDAIEYPPDHTRHVSEYTGDNLFLQYAADKKLREEHPQLEEAWERYNLLLRLYREEKI